MLCAKITMTKIFWLLFLIAIGSKVMELDNGRLFCEYTWVAGRQVLPEGVGNAIAVINPFDGSVLGRVPNLTDPDIHDAIKASQVAQSAWAARTAKERANVLQRWADLIDEYTEDLARILTAEQGKPIKEARTEITYANSFIRWFAEEAKRLYGDVIPATKSNLRFVVQKEAVGVCAAITPWNFPSAMIARKVAPALAAGCTMLVKPSEQTPFSALALAQLATEAGLPTGVLQILTGDAKRLGKHLCTDPRIAKLSFTGSTQVGKRLMAQCADTLKRLSLELGGNAPFIVFDDAHLERAVDALMLAKFRNAGQTCICANRIFVARPIKDKFVALLEQRIKALSVGNGMNPDTDIASLIDERAVQKIQRLLDNALAKGAKLVCGGKCHEGAGFAFEPTIVVDMDDSMDMSQEEIFGPVAAVFVFDSEEEVIARANATPYGLAAYFFCQDHARAWRVSEALQYGMVGHNTAELSNEVAPFGGIKQSGFGREGSKYGIEEYVYTKYCAIGI